MRVSRLSSAFLIGVSLLALPGLSLAGCAQASAGSGAAATATIAPNPTATTQPTTCAQVQGFASATALNLSAMEFPAGTVAQAPSISGAGAGQYTEKTYLACAPNTDTNLTVSTGKGPEPFTTLVLFYGWAPWSRFPASGDAQVACPGTCFAFNAYDPSKGLFQAPPTFLAVDNVTSLGHGLVTFTLRLSMPPPAPDCGYMQSGGLPPIAIWYDQSASIQFPPLTRSQGDDTMSTNGSVQCSAGTVASVKAFMDHQFSSHGYTSVTCASPDYYCWKNSATTVTMSFQSATQWYIFTPRILPTP
jgi:hypothetical protein